MSRYSDLTLNNGEYVQQYAGSPLDVVNNVDSELQNRHYRNISEMSALDLALKQMQSKAVGKGQEYIADQVGQVSQELQNLASNGAENSSAKVAALKNQFLGDQGILRSMEVSQAYNKFLEEKKKTPNPLYNKQLEQDILNTPVKDENGNLTSVYSNPLDFGLEGTLNYLNKQQDVLSGLTADSYETDLKKAMELEKKKLGNRFNETEFFETNTVKALTKNKIDRFIEKQGGWELYKQSPEFKQQLKYSGKTEEQLKEELKSVGYSKMFSDLKRDYIKNSSFGTEPRDGGSGDNPFPQISASGLDPATEIERNTPNLPWNITDKERPGFLLDSKFSSAYSQPEQEKAKEANKNTIDYLKAALEYKGIKSLASGPGGNLPEMTDKDIEAYSKTKEGRETIESFLKEVYTSELNNAYTNIALEPKDRTRLNNKIRSNPQSLLYYDSDGNEIPFTNTDDWKDLTGGKFTSFEHSNTLSPLNIRAGKIAKDVAASGLHTVVGTDKEGMPKIFYVADPADNNPVTRNTNIVYNKGYSKPGIEVPLEKGYSIKYLVGAQKMTALMNQSEEGRMKLQEQGVDINNIPLIEVKRGDTVWLTDPSSLGETLAKEGIVLSYKK